MTKKKAAKITNEADHIVERARAALERMQRYHLTPMAELDVTELSNALALLGKMISAMADMEKLLVAAHEDALSASVCADEAATIAGNALLIL